MVNELVEAKHNNQLDRVMARWTRYELIASTRWDMCRWPMSGAELLFQVIAERAERAAVIVTTNLPFLRVDDGISERATVQGPVGSAHGPSPHY